MITGISIYINGETDEDGLKRLMSGFCDVLVDAGLSNPQGADARFTSIAVAKIFDPVDVDQFAEDILEDSILAVLPIKPEEENE